MSKPKRYKLWAPLRGATKSVRTATKILRKRVAPTDDIGRLTNTAVGNSALYWLGDAIQAVSVVADGLDDIYGNSTRKLHRVTSKQLSEGKPNG